MIVNSNEEIVDSIYGMFFFEKLLLAMIEVVPKHYIQYLLPAIFYLLSKTRRDPCFI